MQPRIPDLYGDSFALVGILSEPPDQRITAISRLVLSPAEGCCVVDARILVQSVE